MSRQVDQPRGFITGLISDGVRGIRRASQRFIYGVEDWLTARKHAQYGLAITRILMGLAALGILLTHWTTRYYTFGAAAAWSGEMEGTPNSEFAQLWLFSAFHSALGNNVIFSALYVLMIALSIPVILGWRFRVIAPFFWVLWVSLNEVNEFQGDQSGNLFRIVFFFLLFADPVKQWSLDSRRRARKGELFAAGSGVQQIGNALHNLVVIAVGAQVILVYLSGGFYKVQGESWRSGVAVYETLSVQRYNTWPVLSEFLLKWGPVVGVATVGTLLLQTLFGAMLLHRFTRVIALIGMVGFHLGIGVLMGLPWFSLIMFAVDAVFVRDRSWEAVSSGLRRRWRARKLVVHPKNDNVHELEPERVE